MKHPTIRTSVSGCLEEWAEGMLTLIWLSERRIATKQELELIDNIEYIGALSDFTGEIGRIAVSLASSRDIAAVREIYEADLVVLTFLSQINFNGRFTKKCEAVSGNTKKVEDILYELSLLFKGARANRQRPKDEEVSGAAPQDNEDEA